MKDISNEVLTKLKTELVGIEVLSSYTVEPASYPTVTFMEIGNTTRSDTVDSSGEAHSDISFEINIFTNGDEKLSDARSVRLAVDSVMSGFFGMNRDYSNPIPNFLNNTVYRFVLRYTCSVSNSNQIYRR